MRIDKHFLLTGLACAGLFFLASNTAQASLIFGVNAIQNPGADLGGPGPVHNNTVVPVTDWTLTTGSFTEVQYSTAPGGVPQLTDPGPPDRGVNLFAGGPNPNPNSPDYVSQGDQILNVANQSATIDTGNIAFTLSGWLGGYFDQRDNALFTAIFENASGNTLGTSTIGPVLLADRTNSSGVPQTELLFRSTMGDIPVGTRQIDFQLTMNGIDGSQNDGYADSLSFIATNPSTTSGVPEPGSMVLLGLGLAGLGVLRRRKTRGQFSQL